MALTRLLVVVAVLFVVAHSSAEGQDAVEEGWDEPAFKKWQVYYQQIAREYEIYPEGNPEQPLQVTPKPVFSYKYPQQFRKSHGAFFVWSHEQKPYAIGCLWSQLEPTGVRTVVHEFHSLAPGGLNGKWKDVVTWNPKGSGAEFKPIEGLEAPAESSDLCHEQLRSIAKPFDGFTHREQTRSLILFPQPLYKYQAPDSGILAGAVFGLFDGRDAEVILMIEARQNGDQRQWEYAAVPFSEVELSMRYDGKEIWSAAARGYSDSTQAFYSPRPAQHDPALEDFKFESLDEENVEAGAIDVEDKCDP